MLLQPSGEARVREELKKSKGKGDLGVGLVLLVETTSLWTDSESETISLGWLDLDLYKGQ